MPLLSYNCAAQKYARCRETVHKSPLISASLMLVGAACFILLPGALIGIFSRSAEVLTIGRTAFPTIGASFPSAAFSLIMPAFFQAIGCGGRSLAVTLTRQIFGLLPVFWLLSLIGLNYTWFAFPVAETAAGGARLHHVPQTAEGVEISHMEKASPFPCEKVLQSSRCRSAAACGGVRRGAE